jgi:hypothetical protein
MAQVSTEARIEELHTRAVKELVNVHAKKTDEPLVLAVRYPGAEPLDVYLFEALDGFPGGEEDELLSTEFEPSAQLRILGKLHLVLGSPDQLESAAKRGDAIVADLRKGMVVFDTHARAPELKKLLGL